MKKTVAMILAVLTAVSLVSCYKGKQPQNTDINNTEITNAGKPDSRREDTPKESPEVVEPVAEPEEKTAEITYNGRVDLNFIEVSFGDGEYGIMRLSEELKSSFDSLEIAEGSKLNITYTEKDGNTIITGIKK